MQTRLNQRKSPASPSRLQRMSDAHIAKLCAIISHPADRKRFAEECRICALMTDLNPKLDERARISALQRYSILDTLPEQIYDDVTALSSLICGTPISLVSLVDTDRQWFKAAVGTEIRETPRELSFCAHTIGTATTLMVRDAREDARFANNPAVTGAPGI